MDIPVIRLGIQRLHRKLIRVEHAVDGILIEIPDIAESDAFLVGDVDHVTDRVF